MFSSLLRIKDVGIVLGISRSKIYELINSGQLEVVRIGRAIRIRRESIERAIRYFDEGRA